MKREYTLMAQRCREYTGEGYPAQPYCAEKGYF